MQSCKLQTLCEFFYLICLTFVLLREIVAKGKAHVPLTQLFRVGKGQSSLRKKQRDAGAPRTDF